MYLALIIEEMLKQRYEGVKNEKGVWITPAFPKLLYVLEDDNVDRGHTVLLSDRACREVYGKAYGAGLHFREKDERVKGRQLLPGYGLPQCVKCLERREWKIQVLRTFQPGGCHDQPCGRGVILQRRQKKFWEIFDERLELCYRALMCRHNRLKGTLSDAAPILWQYGALARLKKGETIDKLLLWRILHDLPRICGTLRVRALYDWKIPHGSGARLRLRLRS